MKLVVAEKPSVAEYLADYLGANIKMDGYFEGNDYCVSWATQQLLTIGRTKDYGYDKWSNIPLPLFPDFRLFPSDDKGLKALLGVNKSLMNKAQIIINATDPESGGELIFRYLYEYCEAKCPVKRLWISSLTKEAIDLGFRNLKDSSQYDRLYLSAKARREADWIVGINASTKITLKTGTLHSLGRIHAPVLKIITDRTKEYRNFTPITYYNLSLEIINGAFTAINLDKHEAGQNVKEELERINLSLDKTCIVSEAVFSNSIEKPHNLYSLFALQVDANKKFGFKAQQTLDIAQNLYHNKFISYPCTESSHLPGDMFNSVRDLFSRFRNIRKDIEYDLEKLSLNNTCLFDDSKVTYHHAIIPTSESAVALNDDEKKLYGLILARFLSCFARDAIKHTARYTLTNKDYTYELTCDYYQDHGWKLLYGSVESYQSPYIELKEGSLVSCIPSIASRETSPKPLFTDATLLISLKNAGKEIDDENQSVSVKGNVLGTPSTQAAIIESLIKSEYIKRKGNSIFSTSKGDELIELISKNSTLITSFEMTALWEENISRVQSGRMSFDDFMNGIKQYSIDLISELDKLSMKASNVLNNQSIGQCPKCNDGNIYPGKKAYYCSNYSVKENPCNFQIFKTISNKKITGNMARQLIEKKKTEMLKFKDDNNRQFEANIILKEDDFTATLMVL